MAKIRSTASGHVTDAKQETLANVDSMLGQRRKRWPNITKCINNNFLRFDNYNMQVIYSRLYLWNAVTSLGKNKVV